MSGGISRTFFFCFATCTLRKLESGVRFGFVSVSFIFTQVVVGYMDFYRYLKDELLAKSGALRSLTQQSKVKGDYTEALVRDFIRRIIPQKFRVGHGIVYNPKTEQSSKECDVIVYDISEAAPLFESQDLVIVDSNQVRIVMQVKSTIDSNTMKEAITNIEAAKTLSSNIIGWIFGFETTVMLRTLYLEAWKSHVVQFLQVLQSKCKKESSELLSNQMKFFIDMIRHYTSPFCARGMNYFIIYDDPKGQVPGVHLHQGMTEEAAKERISHIYREGFWNYFRTANVEQ